MQSSEHNRRPVTSLVFVTAIVVCLLLFNVNCSANLRTTTPPATAPALTDSERLRAVELSRKVEELEGDLTKLKNARHSGRQTLKRGENRIDFVNPTLGALWSVRFVGREYDYRCWLVVAHEGYGNAGFAHKLTVLRDHDGVVPGKALFYAPGFAVKNDQRLYITNDNWPDDWVSVSYHIYDFTAE